MFFTGVYTNFIYVENVVPAEAGTQDFRVSKRLQNWIPACAGTTRYWQCAGWSPSAYA
jgi:hypothetical protein